MSDPRESQTRSPDYLKKPSMDQYAQQISAQQNSAQQISAISKLRAQHSSTQQISATTPQHAQYSAQQISATPITRDVATEGHDNASLTHSGFRIATMVRKCPLTGNTESCQAPTKNPLSTLCSGRSIITLAISVTQPFVSIRPLSDEVWSTTY